MNDPSGKIRQSHAAAVEERRRLSAQMVTAREELRSVIHNVRQNIVKLRRELAKIEKQLTVARSFACCFSV